MFVGDAPEMALFHCKMASPSSFSVEYQTPDPPVVAQTSSQSTSIHIPFIPDCTDLQKVDISIHTLPSYCAHRMPDAINIWFTECFGYEVILAYLGDAPGFIKEGEKTQVWASALKKSIPSKLSAVTFSDTAALLVCSEASLEDLHPRLEGEKVVLEKFRPNIVIDGVGAWDEDYWGELSISRSGLQIILTSNCARCTSINVDLDKGRMGKGPSGALLKKMMKDRRIDAGNKWEPVFGRYGFPTSGGEIRVGDEVTVSVRNKEYTVDSELGNLTWNGSDDSRWCAAQVGQIRGGI